MSAANHEVAQAVADHLRNQARQAGWAHDPAAWARDVLGVHMWSKQREIAGSVISNKRTVVASCHGTGKALEISTLIPVPGGGVIPMGEITAGMQVLGSNGGPVTVVATTGIHTAESYRITLEGPSGFTSVIASKEHVWPVLEGRDQARALLRSERASVPGTHWGLWHHKAGGMTTGDLYRAMCRREKQNLLIPPEIPGLTALLGHFGPDPLVHRMLEERGGIDTSGRPCLTWATGLRSAPPRDLVEARRRLSEQGVYTTLRRERERATLTWTLSLPPGRAASMMPDPDHRAVVHARLLADAGLLDGPGWRIVDVEKAGEQQVQCIQVDAQDHLYLCTESRIPTHNSMIASVIVCWWICTRPLGEAIAVSTAPTYPQVNKILWKEIRKHHATAKRRGTPMPGRVTQADEWKTDDGQILAFGRKPADGDRHGFQGIHAKFVLAVGDEACGLPEEIWTGIEAITTGEHCRMLYIGNPDDRNTEFGKSFLDPSTAQDWNRISVPASSTPNFTGEKVPPLLNDVLVSRAWAEERRRAWGDNDARYISKVLAKFPEASQSSLFPPATVIRAFDEVPPQAVGSIVKLGVDVARFGVDENVVVSYAGRTARIEQTWSGTDTVSSAHQVMQIAEECKERTKAPWVEIRVDAVGLGAGVVDTLNARAALEPQPWFSVYEMHGSAAAPVDVGGSVHGYGNARAFWFDQLRQMMRNGTVKIEENSQIRDDLGIVFYFFRNGRLFIIPKEEMRQKHGRSPDYADALMYATAPVAEGLAAGDTLSEDAAALLAAMDDLEDEREMSISPY